MKPFIIIVLMVCNPMTLGLFAEEFDWIAAQITKRRDRKAQEALKLTLIPDPDLIRKNARNELLRKCEERCRMDGQVYLTVDDIEKIVSGLKARK